ncbi:hypothetical protein [Clostridium tepidiprofundi]|nr:hypothetical protein [Clostridium tepidiprofundi]
MEKELLQQLLGKLDNMQKTMDERFASIDKRFDDVDKRFASIETRLDGMETRLDSIETRLNDMQEDLNEVKAEVKDIKQKNDIIYKQIHDLTEFKTDVNIKLDKIYDSVDFIKYEEFGIKQDIFRLAKNIRLVK